MERLQKVLAHAGVASRRHAEEMILAGRVRVGGRVIRELGTQVDPDHDVIEVNGAVVRAETKTYVLLHKPRGYLSDRDAAQSKPSALDLVPAGERLYAAGRLDANSEGLLLLTNDGELAHKITHPRFEHEKEYLALVEGAPDDGTLQRMVTGVLYDGERLRADSVKRVARLGEIGALQQWPEAGRNEQWLKIVLHEGRKREIRHMCGAVGIPVKRLVRVRIGPLLLGALSVGKYCELTPAQVRELKKIKQRNR